jgi:hypothetical protein
MRFGIAVVVVVLAAAAGQAQQPRGRVIDTNALVVRPVDATTNIFASSAQYVSRVVSGMIDNSVLIRSVNDLFGQRPKAAPIQGGLSPLPDPKLYPSTYYRSPIQPVMPIYPKR